MASECKILSSLLKQYETKQQYRIHIQEFHSGKDLLFNYIPGTYNIIFLDIFMDKENGIDCAMELRKFDKNVNIIFLTTSSDFGVKSYDVQAVDYIIKPPTLEKLSRALGYCKTISPANEPTIMVTSKQQTLEIVLDQILYADFQDRTACIHLKDFLIPVSGSFSELSKQLTAYPEFMPCFKGVVVNLKQVQEVSDYCLVLKNEELLPVSRRLQRQVQQGRLSLSVGSLRGIEI